MTLNLGISRSARLRRVICGGALAAIGGLGATSVAAQGWLPDVKALASDKETVVNVIPRGFGSSQDKLGPVVTMRGDLPEPRDQGNGSESCVGWTMGYGLLSFLQNRKAQPFSPTYVYRWALWLTEYNEEGKWVHSGVDFPQGFAALAAQGSCDFGPPKMSVVKEGTVEMVVFDPLPASWVKQGRESRLDFKPYKLPQHGIVDAMRKALWEKRPLPCGFRIPAELYKGANLERMEGKAKPCLMRQVDVGPSIMHAMLVVGYDNDRRAFEVMNSFGPDFADKGYLWISYDLIASLGADAKERMDNPCLIVAWDYQWSKPENSFEDLQAGFDLGDTTAWVRLADRKGEVNFRGENTTEPLITSLKKNDTLVATQVINVLDSFNASGKEASSNTNTIRKLNVGEKVVVKDMSVLDRKGGKDKEYWIKVKRDL